MINISRRLLTYIYNDDCKYKTHKEECICNIFHTRLNIFGGKNIKIRMILIAMFNTP